MVFNKKILIGLTIVIVILGGIFYFQYSETNRHKFKVVFLNVGQGDAALIQFENSEKILVDCGPDKSILSALGRNLSFFDRTIDTLIISHPDLDHYGGCIDVLKNYNVKKIITNGNRKSDPFYKEWENAISSKNVQIESGHNFIDANSSTLEFFSPDPDINLPDKAGENNYSIVFKLTHLDKKYLFTGDMEEPLEKLLIEKYCSGIQDLTPTPLLKGEGATNSFSFKEKDRMRSGRCVLQSNVLKVGHHGSDTASSELFLSYVKPDTAIISVGKNKFGHPTLRAIRHLERVGAKILRTDETGDILFNN